MDFGDFASAALGWGEGSGLSLDDRVLFVQGQDRLSGAGQHQFNVRGEPVVCTPEDAFRCFMGNELDLLVVGNCVLQKSTKSGFETRLQLRL
jgi:Carbamoyltransferase C-terminus